ncbi:MAG: lipocalin family protein [Phaeodactylibacter sp.]|nr:lipocalin family protein [Phaeodactylibacter sp.]MCB9299062.1 lipocalin family protein [Lewinellaceae bacterium]
MKLNTLLQISLLLMALLAVSACGPEPENQKSLLYGKWELEAATRNGSPTESLAGLYFEFRKDGSMDTNLPAAPGDSRYEIKGKSLQQINGPNKLEYTIQELNDSDLLLTTELRNTSFSFQLKRQTATQE